MWQRPQRRDSRGTKAPPTLNLSFLVTNHEMEHAVWCGNKKTVEIFAQLFDLVAPGYAMDFQE